MKKRRLKKRLLRFVLHMTGGQLRMTGGRHGWMESCPSCKGYPEYPECTCSRRVRFRRFARRTLA